MVEIPGLAEPPKKNKGGRPPGQAKPAGAGATIAALTDKMAQMISWQVDKVQRDLAVIDREESKQAIPSAQNCAARISIATDFAGLLKTLMQVQTMRAKAGDEDGDDGAELGGEAVVAELMGKTKGRS